MNDERKPSSRRRIILWVLIGLAVLALIVGVDIWQLHRQERQSWAEIQKRLDVIRAAGQPVTAEDLAILYPDPPPEHDAALILKPVLDRLKIPEDETNLPFFGGEIPNRKTKIPDAMKTAMSAFLLDNAAALSVLSTAGLSNAWIGCDFKDFPGGNVFQISLLGNLTRTLCIETIYSAELGEYSNAVQSLSRSLACLQVLRGEDIVRHLGRLTYENLACDVFERIINQTTLTERDLTTIGNLLVNIDPNGMQKALTIERCFQIWQMQTIRSDPMTKYAGKRNLRQQITSWYDRISGKLYNDSDFELLLDRWAERLNALELPVKQRFDEMARLNPGVEPDGNKASAALRMSEGTLNYYRDVIKADTTYFARLRTVNTGVALEGWRLAHNGSLPESLNKLVPDYLSAVPIDPFDEQPLRYKKLARGYVIYSIGTDFKDDGGKEKPEDAKDSDPYDITFTVER